MHQVTRVGVLVPADLAPLDKAEAGLGTAAARYVVTGTEGAVLLRIEALLRPNAGPGRELVQAALAPNGVYSQNNKERDRASAARRRA